MTVEALLSGPSPSVYWMVASRNGRVALISANSLTAALCVCVCERVCVRECVRVCVRMCV